MSTNSPATPRPSLAPDDSFDARHFVLVVVTIGVVAAAVSIVVGLLAAFADGWSMPWPQTTAAQEWVTGVLALVLSMVLVVAVVRVLLGGMWRSFYGPRYGRRFYRHTAGRGCWGDPAIEIARERLARGEITPDQFEQFTEGLEL